MHDEGFCAEDEEMYEAQLPLGQEEVKQLYSHTSWQSPQDDPFAAEVTFLLLSLPFAYIHCSRVQGIFRRDTFPKWQAAPMQEIQCICAPL